MGASEVLIDLPTLARWRIRPEGIEIALLDPDGWTRAYDLAFSTPLAVWSAFQGEIPFQAVCCLAPGAQESTLICSRPGGGKSAALASLLQRGWIFHSEDPTRVGLDGSSPSARPGLPRIHLWETAIELLDLPDGVLSRPAWLKDRRTLGATVVERGSVPIGSVLYLQRLDERSATTSRTPLRRTGLESIRDLDRCLYQPRLLHAMGLQAVVFRTGLAMARNARIFHWPVSDTLAPGEIADRIEETLR